MINLVHVVGIIRFSKIVSFIFHIAFAYKWFAEIEMFYSTASLEKGVPKPMRMIYNRYICKGYALLPQRNPSRYAVYFIAQNAKSLFNSFLMLQTFFFNFIKIENLKSAYTFLLGR